MKKPILGFDYRLQLVCFIFILGTSFMIFPLLLLVPFGAYQVINAGVKGLAWGSKVHQIFAMVAGVYGTTITFLAFNHNFALTKLIEDALPQEGYTILIGLVYFLVPVISAIFYINLSHKDYQTRVELEEAWV